MVVNNMIVVEVEKKKRKSQKADHQEDRLYISKNDGRWSRKRQYNERATSVGGRSEHFSAGAGRLVGVNCTSHEGHFTSVSNVVDVSTKRAAEQLFYETWRNAAGTTFAPSSTPGRSNGALQCC